MPGFDGTGPLGNGPFGRGMGPCGGGTVGRGLGRGFFRGNFGWGAGFFSATMPEAKEVMEQRKNWLENQLAVIKQSLQDIEGK
ncbi:DUF5320 domain-containing protein [Flexilinea flocculi]|uniref:Cytoplasmic protein n=1 Tax=Flexilinea flocculi TaxID=1678840 RepID=A0A0K8P9U3_9CHLR|nr:DUF5320 domain-containing protein [Flexilinea flocculi]GAP39433.1 hypothetical protein ATC1_11367 [Flexilinea flocculi]